MKTRTYKKKEVEREGGNRQNNNKTDVARTVNIALRSAISALMAHQHSLFPLNSSSSVTMQATAKSEEGSGGEAVGLT